MDEKEETLTEHLIELRGTLIRCFYSIAIILPFMLFLAPKALKFLIKIIVGNSKITLNFFSPTEVFLLQIKTALVMSIVLCFPYILKQLWNFILPALYENERKFIRTGVFLSSFLFLLGFAFCIFLIVPLIVKFGMSFETSNVNPMFGISNIVNLALCLGVAFGVMFQFPIITHCLIKTEIVSYDTIKNLRPYVVVGILILAGILTPPDIVSQIMLFLPTYLLFELGLLFSRR